MSRCKHVRRYLLSLSSAQRSRPHHLRFRPTALPSRPTAVCLQTRPICLQTRPICLQTRQIQANSLRRRAQPSSCEVCPQTRDFSGKVAAFSGHLRRSNPAILLQRQMFNSCKVNPRVMYTLQILPQLIVFKQVKFPSNSFRRNYLRDFYPQLIANKDQALRGRNFRCDFDHRHLICWHSAFMSANLDTGHARSLESTCRIVPRGNGKSLLARNLAPERHLLWQRRHLSGNGNARF